MQAVLTSIPGAVASGTVPAPPCATVSGSVGDLVASSAAGQEEPGRGGRACRGSQENLERMRGSGRGGERAREGG